MYSGLWTHLHVIWFRGRKTPELPVRKLCLSAEPNFPAMAHPAEMQMKKLAGRNIKGSLKATRVTKKKKKTRQAGLD